MVTHKHVCGILSIICINVKCDADLSTLQMLPKSLPLLMYFSRSCGFSNFASSIPYCLPLSKVSLILELFYPLPKNILLMIHCKLFILLKVP